MASEREAGRGQRQLVPERGAEVRHQLRSGPVAGSNDQEAARAEQPTYALNVPGDEEINVGGCVSMDNRD